MIFLIRHAEPAAGWGEAQDPGLSDLGRRQAEAAAAALRDLGAKAAISSPMRRCRETAAPFEGETGAAARIEPAVSEIKTPDGIADRSAWLRGVMARGWADAGYDFLDWRSAALTAIEALDDGAAVFTHFVAINAIVGLIEEDDAVMVFRPAHCSITSVERVAGDWRVVQRGAESAPRVL